MINPSQINEHMEVIGSDGQHVGTVDKLCVKLTKNDPAAQGQHHLINLDLIGSVEGNTVRLTVPAAEAKEKEKPLGS